MATRVSIEYRGRSFAASYVIRGAEITVTSREFGQLSAGLRLLFPSQKARVLLYRLVLMAEADGVFGDGAGCGLAFANVRGS